MSHLESIAGSPPGTVDSLVSIKQGYVDRTLAWYASRSTWPRVAFRMAGTAVITLSLAIPFLSAAGGLWLQVGVPALAFAIALLSALSAFYGWQGTWQKRITIQLALEGQIARWEVRMDAARRSADPDTAYAAALEATIDLVAETSALTNRETAGFFENIRFPEMPAGSGGGPSRVRSAG